MGVLQFRQGLRRIVEAEVDRAGTARVADVGDQGIVGVQNEDGLPGMACGEFLPGVGQGLGLAVAVELITEEIAEQDRFRFQPVRDLGQPGFVDLEQALRPLLFGQGCRDAPGHV